MTWEDFAVSDVWVDCDPGIDDAVMLAALSGAVGRGRVRLHGLSSVAGNMPLDVTTANLLALASYLALPHVPVARGADRPLVRAACDAAHVHGANGLGEVEIPAGDRALANDSAVLAMHKAICSLAPARRMRLVATGPLTNIALLLRAFPDDAARIQDVVIMGGSTCGGNVTPRAEYNIWADPEAAHMVFASGVPVVMCGLDVTLRSGLSAEQLAAMRDGDGERLCALARMLSFYKGDPAAWPHACAWCTMRCRCSTCLRPTCLKECAALLRSAWARTTVARRGLSPRATARMLAPRRPRGMRHRLMRWF